MGTVTSVSVRSTSARRRPLQPALLLKNSAHYCARRILRALLPPPSVTGARRAATIHHHYLNSGHPEVQLELLDLPDHSSLAADHLLAGIASPTSFPSPLLPAQRRRAPSNPQYFTQTPSAGSPWPTSPPWPPSPRRRRPTPPGIGRPPFPLFCPAAKDFGFEIPETPGGYLSRP